MSGDIDEIHSSELSNADLRRMKLKHKEERPDIPLSPQAQHLKAEWELAIRYIRETMLSPGWSLVDAVLTSNLGPARGKRPAYTITIQLKRHDGKIERNQGNFLKLVREAKKAGFV